MWYSCSLTVVGAITVERCTAFKQIVIVSSSNFVSRFLILLSNENLEQRNNWLYSLLISKCMKLHLKIGEDILGSLDV